jgi:hypothetical protein
MRRLLLLTVVVVAVLLFVLPAVFSGNDTSRTGTTDRPTATVLQAGSDQGGIVHDTLGSETAAIKVSKPERGSQFKYGTPKLLVFTVAVTALEDNISSPDFNLLTSDGQKIDETYSYAGDERSLFIDRLPKGEKRTGTVAFQYRGKHGKLIVLGDDGKPQVTWTF